MFYSRCSIKDKICNLINENESCENIVSKTLVDYLKLDMKPHPHPYDIGWIKHGPHIKITDLCQVPISNGKYYQDSVTCDVVNMDKCHILLGRPWQHDVDVAHRERENIYMLTWKGKRVAVRPISPTIRSKKKMVLSPVSRRNQNDRNSRASSFEEGGANVGDQRTRQGKQQAKIT